MTFKIFALILNLMILKSVNILHLLNQKESIKDLNNTSGRLPSHEKRRLIISAKLRLKRREDVNAKR